MTPSAAESQHANAAPLLPQLRHMMSSSLGFVTETSPVGLASSSPVPALLQRASNATGSTSSTAGPNGNTGGVPVTIFASPEERVEELVAHGQSRRDAVRQVTRENMDAEVQQGLRDTLQSGALPGCLRACGMCCGLLIVTLLLATLLLCLGICICCCVMHFTGLFLTWWLLGCGHQRLLRAWLLLYQMFSLLESCLASLIRGCLAEVTEALDSRVRPGFAKVCGVCYTVLSAAFKVLWCMHVQSLVVHPTKDGCGARLPLFMSWYSCVLLLQLLVVEPLIKLGMSLVLWLATNGHLSTTRGAKAGTLESMQVVEYNDDLFADSSEPNDARPQKECCICLDEYDVETPIIKTPCQHLMHRECLAKWLQSSHYCPLCRGDLEESRLP